MIRKHNLGFDKNLRLRFAAATLFIVACSAAAEDPNVTLPPGSGAPGISGAPNGGSGGSGFTPTSGTGPFTPGGGTSVAGRAGVGGAGGTPGAGGTSAGAATGGRAATVGGGAAVAGAATGVAGASTGTGGSGSTSCDTYKGTVGAKSTIFNKSGFGTSTLPAGTEPWKGYAFSYKFGTGVTLAPDSKAGGCFTDRVCIAGSIPADDEAGVGIGWNINQTGTTPGRVPVTTAVKVTLQGGSAGMRVALKSASAEFCAPLPAATGGTVPLTAFKTECWGDKGTAYVDEPIEAIQVSVPGSKSGGAKTFDLCIVDIEPG